MATGDPYATGDDMVTRHDVDVIGDLLQDDRERLDRALVADHPTLLTLLRDASGEIETSASKGGIYTRDDLVKIADGEYGTNQQAFLARVTCWICMALLFERRPAIHQELAEAYLERANRYLIQIQNGDKLFGVPGAGDSNDRINAGMPTIDGPTSLEYEDLQLMPDRLPRFFPPQDQRIPIHRR